MMTLKYYAVQVARQLGPEWTRDDIDPLYDFDSSNMMTKHDFSYLMLIDVADAYYFIYEGRKATPEEIVYRSLKVDPHRWDAGVSARWFKALYRHEYVLPNPKVFHDNVYRMLFPEQLEIDPEIVVCRP